MKLIIESIELFEFQFINIFIDERNKFVYLFTGIHVLSQKCLKWVSVMFRRPTLVFERFQSFFGSKYYVEGK